MNLGNSLRSEFLTSSHSFRNKLKVDIRRSFKSKYAYRKLASYMYLYADSIPVRYLPRENRFYVVIEDS